MNRTDQFIEWWRTQSGKFINIEQILPYVVLHKVPDATDRAPTPLLIGPASLQSTVIDSHDPQVCREHLVEKWGAFSADVVVKQRLVADRAEPDLTVGRFSETGARKHFDFSRLLLPVRTTTGQKMLMAYTSAISVS